ncbi:MAG: hypothetical protein ACM3XS_00665 [Bacteroidota bacterium]
MTPRLPAGRTARLYLRLSLSSAILIWPALAAGWAGAGGPWLILGIGLVCTGLAARAVPRPVLCRRWDACLQIAALLLLIAFEIRLAGQMTAAAFLPGARPGAIGLAVTLAAFFLSGRGLRALIPLNDLLLPISLAALAGLLLPALTLGGMDRLTPVPDPVRVREATIPAMVTLFFAPLGQAVGRRFLGYAPPVGRRVRSLRSGGFFALGLGAAAFACAGVFGPVHLASLRWPLLELARAAFFSWNVFERADLIFLLAWLPGSFVIAALALTHLRRDLARLVPRWISPLAAAVASAGSWCLAQTPPRAWAWLLVIGGFLTLALLLTPGGERG